MLAGEDLDAWFREIPRALLGRDDDGTGPIALQAAIEQPMRIGDHGRGLMILERHRTAAHHRARIAVRVLAERHGDPAELLARGSVQMHVTPRR